MEIQTNHKPKMTAKDFFLYLGILITLYVSSIALISFLFTAVNIGFPNPQDYFDDPTDSIAWSLSVFIVFYPILMILLSFALNGIRKFPEKAALGVRHWFIYLTLFVTALTIAIDLIVLINHFLGGHELTTGFILKVISILVVAGFIFWFSLKDLQGLFIQKQKVFSAFRAVATIVVIALIVFGLFIIGSPAELRNKQDDQQRVQDLNVIQSEIISYWQAKEALPERLSILEDDLTGFSVPMDPKTDSAYEYKIINENTFELCATFLTDSTEYLEKGRRESFGIANSFEHKAERTCFERTIDPDKYPLLKPVPAR